MKQTRWKRNTVHHAQRMCLLEWSQFQIKGTAIEAGIHKVFSVPVNVSQNHAGKFRMVFFSIMLKEEKNQPQTNPDQKLLNLWSGFPLSYNVLEDSSFKYKFWCERKKKLWNKCCLLNSSQKLQQKTQDQNHKPSHMGAEPIKGTTLKQDLVCVYCDLEFSLAERRKESKAKTWACWKSV